MQFHESERLLVSVLGNLRDAFLWVSDEQPSQFRVISTSAGSVLGHPSGADDDADMHLELHVEEDRALVQQAHALLRAGQLPAPYRARVRASDDSIRWIEYRFSDLRAHPDVRGFVGLARDVTHDVADEEAGALEALSPIASARGEVLVVVDADGTVLGITRNVVDVLGFDAAELQGRPVDFVHPSDRPVLVGCARWLHDAAPGVSIGPGRIRGQRLDGSWITLEYVATRHGTQPGSLLVSLRDVTREVHAESALVARLEHGRRAGRPLLHPAPVASSPAHEVVCIAWRPAPGQAAGDLRGTLDAVQSCVARLAPVLPCADGRVDHVVLVSVPGGGAVLAAAALEAVAGMSTPRVQAVAGVAAADAVTVAAGRAIAAAAIALADPGLAHGRRVVVVDEELEADLDRRRSLEDDAVRRLLSGHLVVRFRPDVLLSTGAPWGGLAEPATVDGPVPADVLVTLARGAGLGPALHRQLVDRVADHLTGAAPARSVVAPVRVALSLRPGCPATEAAFRAAEHRALPPGLLAFEAGGAVDLAEAAHAGRRCRDLGIGMVVTGVGGDTPLAVVRAAQPSGVRLCASVTRALGHDPAARAVADGVARLADGLGVPVAADGVDDEAALTALRHLGVQAGTGAALAADPTVWTGTHRG